MRARSIQELLDWEPPEVDELVGGGLLHPGSRMVIFGRWGTWKSMLSIHLSFCLAQGEPWLGFKTKKSSVHMAQVEIPEYKIRERIQKYVGSNGHQVPDNFHILSHPYLRLDQTKPFGQFQDDIKRVNPRVIILDPFYRLFSGDIADNHQVQLLIDRIDKLAVDLGLATVLVGHTRKPKELPPGTQPDWGQELIGGSYIMDWVDTAIAIEPTDPQNSTLLKLHFVKVRHGTEEMPPMPVKVSRDTLHFSRVL